MTNTPIAPLVFTADELDLLGQTADALSAYMGKPVLAEVMDARETGFEWVIFAVPLDVGEDANDLVTVQIGGQGARLLGSKGGMEILDGDVYACEYLWAIQLTDLDGLRFIKLDQTGDEIAWAETLQEVLPFAMEDDEIISAEDDEDEDEDGDEGEGSDGAPARDVPGSHGPAA
ncbi:hypothetical protein ERD78_02200 [Allopusillimonas soli]|uniref:Uncharacterized protein n=1 Tax=Allopusillimonas soli TaxID=659016 RepID=A0A853F9R3_9BURK|nr:hypothetical protein [Allopusillimonas soli]NYT35670.1 hypothetical protein [Allopusillimonas soli]TEA76063.1 hypothetical protein ERD78_02200 [Allopusillimonas soli]